MRLGATEILLIVLIGVVVFGGSKISGLGKALGSSIRDFKKEMREDKAESETFKTENKGSDNEGN